MTDNEIIEALKRCPQHTECCYCNSLEECGDKRILTTSVFNLINRQKDKIERLNKNYEELIYKTECLLCHATGNKFSKYTYTTQEMISFVDDYIQDCCDEAIEETKANVKSEAIKECLAKVKNYIKTHCNPYGKPDFDYDTSIKILNFIDNILKEMTEVNDNDRA